MGRRIVAEKAGPFFSKLSASPETAEFRIARPAIHRELSDKELAELIRERIRKEEAEIQAQMAREGREFLGRTGILKLSPNTQASSHEPLGKMSPRVAASHRSLRIGAIESLRPSSPRTGTR